VYMSPMVQIGSRHEKLLEAWADTIATQAEGEQFDFTSPTRSEQLATKVQEYLEDPSEERFRAFWDRDIIRDAVYGGPNSVLNHWNGGQADLADYIRDIRDAESYDPAWERRLPGFMAPAIRELYGRLQPANRPIFNRAVRRGLSTFGFGSPNSVADAIEPIAEFEDAYQTRIGHVTAGTDHEVPLSEELEQFCHVVRSLDEPKLRSVLDMDTPTYAEFSGWDAYTSNDGPIQLHGLSTVLDAFSEGTDSEAYERGSDQDGWGANHWETWKDDYCEHLQAEVFTEYDPTALEASDVEPFLEELSINYGIDDVVPIYLLGGRWQPWESFKDASVDDPETAATVLSALLDEEGDALTDRLNAFNDFYAGISDSGSERMSVATLLLMITHPDKYPMYRYTMFSDFFSEFSSYELPTGFNPGAYQLMREALARVRADLDETTEHDVTMLDIHSLLWVVHRQGVPG